MQGKIIKGIAGFYYVHVENYGVFECKAKGIFRNRHMKPLVGDNVIIDIIDEQDSLGNISDILPRDNVLIRPAAANVDQAVVIFAVSSPDPNYNLLDRFLVMMNMQYIPTVVCFNKTDLTDSKEIGDICCNYRNSGSSVIFVSALEKDGIQELEEVLRDKTTILAGPSGAGKSSITNLILPKANMETGDVSKIGRGRHTTRHSELFHVRDMTYIMDTPGFTSLMTPELEKEEIRFYYNEFDAYEGKCRFHGCVHINEPSCAVKDAVEAGNISKVRYSNYVQIYNELKEQRKY